MSRERVINNTKNLLKKSLFELLEHKPLSKITIKELCLKADINRTTYYHYYLDPYDQLEKIKQEIFKDMKESIDKVLFINIPQEDIIKCLLNYINENKNEFRVLLEHTDFNFQNELLSFAGKRIFEKDKRLTEKEAMKYIYATNGTFGIIAEWIKDNIKLCVNDISELIVELNK